jgi:HSP20 family protein
MTDLTKQEGLFDDLFDFRKGLDELYNRMLSRSPWLSERVAQLRPEMPPIETWIDRDEKTYHLRLALPGVDPQDVQLNVQGNVLSVRAERKNSRESKEANFLRREISYGVLERRVPLPEGVEASKITAEQNNGLLEISAPIATAALPRRIEVKSSSKSKTVGA